MDEESVQIIKHIAEKREELGDNLAELEQRVRYATDWRTYFARQPWLMIGASALGGLLLAALFTPARRCR
ncbi:MAG TPA: hypothetical protein VKU01_21665 [Bryobacteraceae bacterium]|nr:hypothetical protein [Bryobacteraceae bacterium]